MDEPKAYPLRLSPLPGESLRGYMHRFALRNGVPYFNWIVTDLGLKNISTALTAEQIRRLSTISGTSMDELSNRQATLVDGETLLLGQRVSLCMVERETSRLCLECFREQPYHRLIWDFTPVTDCPIHGTPITRHCPHCGAVLHWRRNHLHKCPNGHSLLQENPADDVTPDGSTLAGVRAICERLAGREAWAPTILPWSELVLPVRDLVDMLEFLGRLALGRIPNTRRGSRNIHESDDHHLVLARGHQIATDWPRAFRRVLDEQATTLGGLWLADSSHPVRKFLHGQLCRHERTYRRPIGEEIWRYAGAKGMTLSAGAFGFTPADFRQTFVSSTQARSLMQVSTDVLQRIAHKESWPGAGQLSTGKFAWLRRADVEAWCRSHRNGISATKLARRFHISQVAILEMARLGLFGEEARYRRPAQLKARWHALPHEAQAFIDKLRTALAREPERDASYVNWSGFTKRLESRSVTVSHVVAGIIQGKVRAVSKAGENLASLRFNVTDALALARSALPSQAAAAFDEIKLPLRKIKELFHVEHPFLMRAIALGLLSAEERHFGAVRFWVKPSDMEDFLKRFTTIGLLARRFGKSAPSVSAALRQFKVHPHNTEVADAGAPKLFAWSDIHVAGLKRIIDASKSDSLRSSRTPMPHITQHRRCAPRWTNSSSREPQLSAKSRGRPPRGARSPELQSRVR